MTDSIEEALDAADVSEGSRGSGELDYRGRVRDTPRRRKQLAEARALFRESAKANPPSPPPPGDGRFDVIEIPAMPPSLLYPNGEEAARTWAKTYPRWEG